MTTTDPGKSETTTPDTPTPDGGQKDRLDRASERLEKISGMLATLGTVGEDPLTGSVTLQDKAGTLGGWLAHREVATAADDIAQKVHAILDGVARVLVVDSRDVLGQDATAARVRDWMPVAERRLANLVTEVQSARAKFTAAGGVPQRGDLPRPVQDLLETLAAGEEPGRSKKDAGKLRAPAEGLVPVKESPSRTAATGAEAEETTAAGGVAGALLGFLALAREDYDLGAVEVTVGPTELSTLVAGYLAQAVRTTKPAENQTAKTIAVEVDTFRTSGPSPTLASYRTLTTKLDALADALGALADLVTPAEARRDALKARVDAFEKKWTDAVAAKDTPAGAADQIDGRMREVTAEQQRLDAALAPIGSLVAGRTDVLQDVRARLAELTTAPAGGGLSPLAESVRYERLSAPSGNPAITHVLYVHVDALGGDKVTRKTWLGEPGRLGFLGSVNSSWLLASTDGTVAGGAAAAGAARLTYDLGTGQSALQTVDLNGQIVRTARDRLASWTPAFAAALVLAVLLSAAAPILEVLLTSR